MYAWIQKHEESLLKYNANIIILALTLVIVLSSIAIVYLVALLFNIEYTNFLLALSIVVPAIQAPLTISIILKSSKHLKGFRDELEREMAKNRVKDVMLFEQARFVLMGEMMANISHQWKQPLNTIGLSVVSLRTSNSCPQEIDKYFDIMDDNVSYLASTIDDFMSFFDKKTHLELRTVESLIREVKSIVSAHMSNSGIDLEIVVDDNYGEIEIASSISQVVLNLINNAKDAGGKKIRVLFMSNEYGLEIECCDNGKGIDESIREKIFDPYFTTKEKSQGTGIGLHMSKEIVQKVFNGEINVSLRESSRSELHPKQHLNKTCFCIVVPYSSKCVVKKEFS